MEVRPLLATRELLRKKGQFGLVTLVVAMVSYLVLMVNGLGAGLNEIAGSALLNFDADAFAYPEPAGLSIPRAEMSQELVDRAASLEGVEESAPLGYLSASYRSVSGDVHSAAFLAFDPGSIAEPRVVEGEPLPADGGGMLADRSFLRESGHDVGDEIEVGYRLETFRFRITGVVDEGQFFFQPTVYILRDTWRTMRYGDVEDSPVASVVLLRGDDIAREAEGLEVVSPSTAFANIEGVSGQSSTVLSLQLFGYIIGALIVGVFFYVLTLQKVPLVGMLKAIGAGSGFVVRQLFLQVLVVSLAGLAIAMPLAWFTERMLSGAAEVPIALEPGTYLTTGILLVATALIGGLISARQVFRTEPLIALGQQV